ncbi:MAG: GNAT family N-acetyltransferase [Bdellovibrio sp.]|nr:GNAT family N-acetyltransferase [Bdellovibrio sp.]
MQQPILHTDRLIFEPFNPSDVQDIFSYAKDVEVAKMVTWPAHQSLEDSQNVLKWIEQTTSNQQGRIFFVWALRDKITNKVIGSIDFKNVFPHAGQIDYALGKSEWNRGLVTEAANAVKNWAFESVPNLVRLQAFCIAENVGSRKVMEKLGMHLEGTKRKSMAIKGQIVDTAHYAIIK